MTWYGVDPDTGDIGHTADTKKAVLGMLGHEASDPSPRASKTDERGVYTYRRWTILRADNAEQAKRRAGVKMTDAGRAVPDGVELVPVRDLAGGPWEILRGTDWEVVLEADVRNDNGREMVRFTLATPTSRGHVRSTYWTVADDHLMARPYAGGIPRLVPRPGKRGHR